MLPTTFDRKQSYEPQKAQVPSHFDAVASRYDLLQRLNPGYHKHLALSAQRLQARPQARILDLCCGTGLSTVALVRAYPQASIVALDASLGMLEVARKKRALCHVRLVRGDAMDPTAADIGEARFDAIFMAYGIRNMPDRNGCLLRVRELLVPGGTVAFHEYSVAGAAIPKIIWKVVSSLVIVPLGHLTTGSPALFKYLRESVLAFDSVPAFEARLADLGFCDIKTLPMRGWQGGIVHTFLARRPP